MAGRAAATYDRGGFRAMTNKLRMLAIAAPVVFAACQPPPATGGHGLGLSCAADGDCAEGLRCDVGVPGGECTKPCAAAAECGPTGACVGGQCLLLCGGDGDCRNGFTCRAAGDAMVCLPAAHADAGADADAPPDLATGDLASVDQATQDLATTDLAMADLAMPDLATPPDLAMPDLATPPDLVAPPDLVTVDLGGLRAVGFAPPVGLPYGHSYPGFDVGDLNGDGKLDAVVADEGTFTVGVLLGNGDGTFQAIATYPVNVYPSEIAIGDLDGDGKPDVVAATAGLTVLRGKGDGTLAAAVDSVIGVHPVTFALADLDGDGHLDAAAIGQDGALQIARGDGAGGFQKGARYPDDRGPYRIAIADLDKDGKPDIVLAELTAPVVRVLRGNGDGTFQQLADFVNMGQGLGVGVHDLDNDGRQDIVVSDGTGVSVVYNSANGFLAPIKGVGSRAGDIVFDGTMVAHPLVLGGTGAPGKSIEYYTFQNWMTPQYGGAFADSQKVRARYGGGLGTWVLDQQGSLFVAKNALQTVVTTALPGPAAVSSAFWTATGDFDGDGKADLAAADMDNNKLAVALGKGDGTFGAFAEYGVTNATTSYPGQLVAGDLNADGRDDLVLTDAAGKVDVLLANANGSFPAPVVYTAGTFPSAAAIGDLDGDGKPDLAIANLSSNNLTLLRNGGGGAFQALATLALAAAPASVAIADFDGDGHADLAVTERAGPAVAVLLGTGGGQFKAPVTYAVATSPWQLAAADLDGNGRPDLVVVNDSPGSGVAGVLLGKGDGTFQARVDYPLAFGARGLVVRDFNGDNVPDVAAPASLGVGRSLALLRGVGDGTFAAPVVFEAGTPAASIAAADFDRDGRLDLAIAGEGACGHLVLLRNTSP